MKIRKEIQRKDIKKSSRERKISWSERKRERKEENVLEMSGDILPVNWNCHSTSSG